MVRALAIGLAALGLAAPPAGACCRGVHLMPHGRPITAGRDAWPPLAIGDSVMIPAARRLARGGIEVDAREGRFMRSAIRILATRRRRHRRPHVVVVGLGTNFPVTYAEIRRALKLLGPGRTLAFV